MTDRPSGTVTFLFTDIEGSTKRWEADPDSMHVELAAHDEALRSAVESQGGWLFKHTGDGVCAAFGSARAAVEAAVVAQRGLGLLVRMGIASGEAELRGDDYFGLTLNTAARVMAAGHGGQILLAASTAVLTSDVEMVDLGMRSLRDLSAPMQLFQVRAEGLRTEFPSLRTVDVVPGNLPVQSTSFVGRDDAVDTIVEAVTEHRVVTLIGVGGVGKTRLALHSAAVLARQFRDGVWLIELGPVTDGNGVAAAVAAVFMLQPQPERTWQQIVVDGLRSREVLLVIDNCEHVLDETASLVEAVVAGSGSMSVLVTSRESLGVRGEWAWRVPSLAGTAAIELFIERADAAASGFRPDQADLVVIGEICDRLDGIALAIELAAARVRSMSPTQIRDRLDERFRLLTGSRRSIERHQTLRHAVQWSYDLLEPTEQAVLRQVSVFVGGFSLHAATAITELDEYEVLDVLDSLVRKSLLQVERADSEVRYRLLETIRQFAEEALAATGTSDDTRDRHTDYFANQSDVVYEFLRNGLPYAITWVDSEITNVAAAFEWATSRGHADAAVRIAANTHLLARNRLRTETFGWPERVIELARRSKYRQLPHLLTAACDAATGVGRLDDAARYGLEAIALNDDTDSLYDFDIEAYYVTGMALFMLGDLDRSLRVLRIGAEHPADDPARPNLLFLHVLTHMGGVAMPERESVEAIAKLKVSPVSAMRAGGLWVQANLVALSDPKAAIALYQQAIDADSGSRTLEETCRGMQLGLISRTGDLEAAFTGFAHVIDAWQTAMGDIYAARGLGALTTWLAGLGYSEGAARIFGATTKGRPENWMNRPAEVLALPDVMGEAAFTEAFEAGAALDIRAAAALAHQLLAQVRHDLGPLADSIP